MTIADRFRANPADVALQAQLGVILVETGDVDGLRQMFNTVHLATRGGLRCAQMVGQGLALRHPAALYRLLAAYSRGCPFRGPLLGAAGYARALEYDLDGTAAALREGLGWVCLAQARVDGEQLGAQGYSQLARAAFLFEPAGWDKVADPADPELTVLHQGAGDGAFACLAAADSLYFTTYGPGFLAGLQAEAGDGVDMVLVIVGPDAAALDCAAELAARHPRATILAHPYGGAKMAEYCSGTRFLVAKHMLRRLGKPVVFMDADSNFVPGCGEVLAHIAAQPLASLHRQLMPPFLIAEASVVAAQPGGASERFFDDASAYFQAKMAETGPLWHVDQVALHRAIALARHRGVPPVDLGRLFGGAIELPAYFKKPHTLNMDGRAATRTDASIDWAFTLEDDGKPCFQLKSTSRNISP